MTVDKVIIRLFQYAIAHSPSAEVVAINGYNINETKDIQAIEYIESEDIEKPDKIFILLDEE